ncbi:short-chain dehydrogenase [Trypanosoma rangeli]|uniref:Short-chain dehydrogenase n=1 Tax=Trypanosoma rangeli TaxID=5698 RepID=A0A3R7K8J6_TRYRA|nr:short-chain dehydrogenase [Trypanosoma rangeli]RNF01715.1 short-chain dehydrogenase [Trypanosoma rangeli]|eukprot:RNF01715.1 short-chain dehydrogenase [Trypanosoma rangeli]
MRLSYKSEIGAICTACVAAVCFVALPRSYLTVAVPVWLVAQRLVARGFWNYVQPPQKGIERKISKEWSEGVLPRGWRPGFVMSHDMKEEERPVAVVTGTNSGIGYYTAVGLAVEGYRVVCTCRNPALSESTAVKIREEAEGARRRRSRDPRYAEVPETVLVDGRFSLECDDFASVRRFTNQFQAAYQRLDVLVNNAGMMRKRLEFSRHNSKLELHTAVNFLGPLLLTELLVPFIQQSQGRVVYVSSEAHRFPQMSLEPGLWKRSPIPCLNGRLLSVLQQLNQGESGSTGPLTQRTLGGAFVRYGTSKLLNIYHAHYIARHHRLPVCSLHPGCVGTNFSKDLVSGEWIKRIYQYVCLLFLKTWEEGAQTTLHCTMCDVDELRLVKPLRGSPQTEPVSPYFVECRNQTLEALLSYGWDVEEADRIVEWGKQLVGLTQKSG